MPWPSNLRRISCLPARPPAIHVLAPLSCRLRLLLVGLTSGLGMARTVWGGPPADAEPPAEAGPEQPTEDPTLVGSEITADPVATAPVDAPPTEPTEPSVPTLDEAGASVPGASSLRAQMESSMSQIGELAVDARQDEDLVRATCVLDKQDRANDVMDLGTSELLIIRDSGTSDQARAFALEKLEARQRTHRQVGGRSQVLRRSRRTGRRSRHHATRCGRARHASHVEPDHGPR